MIHCSTSCDQCASGHRPAITSLARSSEALSSGGASSFVLCRTRSRNRRSLFLLNPPGGRIKENLIRCSKIVREKFAKPLFTDARDLREQNDQFVIPALDFANFAGHEQRTLLDNAFSSQDAMSAVDKIAAQGPGIDALG